jgi:hypothetical protein
VLAFTKVDAADVYITVLLILMLGNSSLKDLADKARSRVERGLNPESFARRVYEAKKELQLTDLRIQMILAVAHEIRITCFYFSVP